MALCHGSPGNLARPPRNENKELLSFTTHSVSLGPAAPTPSGNTMGPKPDLLTQNPLSPTSPCDLCAHWVLRSTTIEKRDCTRDRQQTLICSSDRAVGGIRWKGVCVDKRSKYSQRAYLKCCFRTRGSKRPWRRQKCMRLGRKWMCSPAKTENMPKKYGRDPEWPRKRQQEQTRDEFGKKKLKVGLKSEAI